MTGRRARLDGKLVRVIGPDPELGGVIVEERRFGKNGLLGTFWRRVSEAELEPVGKERPP
jgi:hypothetical protein